MLGGQNGLQVFCTDCGQNGTGVLSIHISGAWYSINTTCMNPVSPFSGIHVATPTQIIWNWNAVLGAGGYKFNTTNNYATATDMGTATTKTDTGLLCNTAYTRYVWAYNACGNSASTALNQSTTECTFTCGSSLTINHVAGAVAPVNKTTTYGTVTNIPGEPTKCWITNNLGSDHQATAVDDATEASAGWYWQFNRKQGYKHDGAIRTPNTIWIWYINENSDWPTMNDPCSLELGANWRIPTYTEWYNVRVWGSWNSGYNAWGSNLKLHNAGMIQPTTSGPLLNRGICGYYWSSTQYDITNGWDLDFSTYNISLNNGGGKAPGLTLRCLRD